MVCEECHKLRLEGYHRVHANRSGLMTPGIHRRECNCGFFYEKITDRKLVKKEEM